MRPRLTLVKDSISSNELIDIIKAYIKSWLLVELILKFLYRVQKLEGKVRLREEKKGC